MKSFILIFTFSLLSLILKAQETFVPGFTGFGTLGLCTSQINGDGLVGFNKFGINVGAGTAYRISPGVSLGFDLLYNRRGSRDYNSIGNAVDSLYRVNYVDLPIRLNLRLNKKFTLRAGPYVGFLISASFFDGSAIRPTTNKYFPQDFGAGAGFVYKVSDKMGLELNIAQTLIFSANRFEGFYHLFCNANISYRLTKQ